jgi:phage tail-like protein
MAVDANRVSTLLDSLPAVFQENRVGSEPTFLGRFLLGFEQVLLGLDGTKESEDRGLEETIASIHSFFDPGAELSEGERTPKEFLGWLAGWVALNLRQDFDEPRQRELIANAAPLYRLRGTKRGVEEFLRIYTRLGVMIDELIPAFKLAVHATVGVDTRLDGGAPFFFRVRVFLPNAARSDVKPDGADPTIIKAIVDLQKPAHTFYALSIETRPFRAGAHATVGFDTYLGHHGEIP